MQLDSITLILLASSIVNGLFLPKISIPSIALPTKIGPVAIPTSLPIIGAIPTAIPTALPVAVPTAIPTSVPTNIPIIGGIINNAINGEIPKLPTDFPIIPLPTSIPQIPGLPTLEDIKKLSKDQLNKELQAGSQLAFSILNLLGFDANSLIKGNLNGGSISGSVSGSIGPINGAVGGGVSVGSSSKREENEVLVDKRGNVQVSFNYATAIAFSILQKYGFSFNGIAQAQGSVN
ncbi:uncharacterized protein KGF55_005588 [Candida pseudojiufengensis]|uniref:uncharacterized protein n=1 Tax=Candida pseudojiufengensis TaxID=497109 RepID=UPI002224763D|nr:uncharacterized protein KGF55_005588 [Candida pseudojiufengensis]KAI5959097.1 hypothetical protein KGF55_005588 [Candida pseudojiufengensis]